MFSFKTRGEVVEARSGCAGTLPVQKVEVEGTARVAVVDRGLGLGAGVGECGRARERARTRESG